MSDELTLAEVQEMILTRPFHRWLGLEVLAVTDESIELKATWREEWVVNPQGGWTHGGILAALVDLTADWAMIRKLGRPAPTIDMRVDYHSAAKKGDLICKGRIVRMGGQFSCAEASIHDTGGKLLASGRGTYASAPVPAKS
ncbi:MAG TPA: PaaI family thioesterase [Burkholderiales bacterium]